MTAETGKSTPDAAPPRATGEQTAPASALAAARTAEDPGARLRRRIANFSLTALVVLLPALAGARGLAGPVRASERACLRLALDDTQGDAPSTIWWRLWLPDELVSARSGDEPIAEQALDRAVPSVRRGNLLLLLASSALVFAAVALTRGRVAAAAACLSFAFLPPVAVEGHFVRAETVGLVFALAALVILLGLPTYLRQRGRPFTVFGFGMTTAMLIALAIAATPFYGVYFGMLVGALLGAVVPLMIRWGRPLARGRFLAPPAGQGFSKRLLPWLLPSIAALPLSWWTLSAAGEYAQRLEPAAASVGAVPAGWVGFGVTIGLAAFGGSFLAIRVLADALRERRTTRAVVCAAFVVPLLVKGVRSRAGVDLLPVAAAVSMVVGMGIAALLWIVVPALLKKTGAMVG